MNVGTNWAGNLTFDASRIRAPQSVEEAQEIVAGAARIKALGSAHCFNTIADSEGGEQIVMNQVPMDVSVDAAARTVTVPAAARYGDIAPVLDAEGFAVENLASLPHITVAGTIATATHGSGESHPSLSANVAGIEYIAADGELHNFARGDVEFPGSVVSVGALGIATKVTLDLVPSYHIRQDVYEDITWDMALANFDEIEAAAYSVSFFTTWVGDSIEQLWLKSKVVPGVVFDERDEIFGARRATVARHPADHTGASAEVCSDQLGVAGPWYERVCHFKLEFTPSSGAELQTEFLIPRRHAIAAFETLRRFGDRINPLLIVSELRTIAADDLWLSPFRDEDCAAVHFTWKPMQPEVEALLPDLERALRPFEARPHWGKLFHGGNLDPLYPKIGEFRSLAERLDPDRKFGNKFLTKHVYK